jgi:hypothetical protein
MSANHGRGTAAAAAEKAADASAIAAASNLGCESAGAAESASTEAVLAKFASVAPSVIIYTSN